MTTYELAKLLLSKEDTILKLGKYDEIHNIPYYWEVEELEVLFGEESTIIQEKL